MTAPTPAAPRQPRDDRRLTRRAVMRRATGLPVAALAGLLAACRRGEQAPASTAIPPRLTGGPAGSPAATTARATPAPTAPIEAVALPTRTAAVADIPVRVGPARRVFGVPQVAEPHIAVDPTDPERLAAVAIAPEAWECDGCPVRLVLGLSDDGGATWREGPLEAEVDGVVAFGADGTLYAVGLVRGSTPVFRAGPGEAPPAALASLSDGVTDKPWLTLAPDGALLVPYLAPATPTRAGIVLRRSADGGRTWAPAVVLDPGVEDAAVLARRALPPNGAQALAGGGGAVAVAWVANPTLDRGEVRVALSADGGRTFAPPRALGGNSGLIATAARGEAYYVVYYAGTVEASRLAVAASRDAGATWAATTASDVIRPAIGLPAPGVGVAPDGTLDIVFYATADPACFDAALAARRRWLELGFAAGYIDPCAYHVYHTCSRDGGRSFSAPTRLNEAPIVGSRFVRIRGVSRPGEYIGAASTDACAHAIWVDTQGEVGTQALMARIER